MKVKPLKTQLHGALPTLKLCLQLFNDYDFMFWQHLLIPMLPMEVAIVNDVPLVFFFFFFLIISPESLLLLVTTKKFHVWTLKFHHDEPCTVVCQSFCEEKVASLGTQGQPGS